MWRLASPSVRKASRLKTQASVDVVVLTQKFFFPRKPQIALRPSTDYMKPTHIAGHIL